MVTKVDMELLFKVEITLFVLGGILILLGIVLDIHCGYFSKWENMIYVGGTCVLTSVVSTGIVMLIGMWLS